MRTLILLLLLLSGCAAKQRPVFFVCEHEGKFKACSFKADGDKIAIQAHEFNQGGK